MNVGGLVAALVAVVFATAACVSSGWGESDGDGTGVTHSTVPVSVIRVPVAGGVDDAPLEFVDGSRWPEGLLDRILGADGSYAWQKCRLNPDGELLVGEVGAVSPAGGLAVFQSGSSFLNRVVAAGDMTMLSERDGPWEPTEDRRWAGIDLALLRTVEGVTALFDLDATVADPADPTIQHPLIERVPTADGGPILRLEGQSDGWLVGPLDEESVAARQRLATLPLVVWVLDVWGDGGQVERLRFQRQAFDPVAIEIRFLPIEEAIVDGILQQPMCRPGDDSLGGWRGFEPWATDRSPLLQVTLDSNGRPFDEPIRPGHLIVRETIGTINAPDGELLVMNGNSIEVSPVFFADEGVEVEVPAESVATDGVQVINVDVVWDLWPAAPSDELGRSVAGVWIGPHDAQVETWDDFEAAYLTDGGVGGVIPKSVVELDEESGGDDFWIDDGVYSPTYRLLDLDGIPGTETLIFSNGIGDGVFPLSRGRDGNGEVVAVLIWHFAGPWRAAAPDGRPPSEVTTREEELLECIAGERPVNVFGFCEPDLS